MTERAVILNPWKLDARQQHDYRWSNWLEGGLRRDELMIREGFEDVRGGLKGGFNVRYPRCQGFMADGESQCGFSGVVRGQHGLMFCKRHGPQRELRTANLVWASSRAANRRDATLHIVSMHDRGDQHGQHGDPLCGGIKKWRVDDDAPTVQPLHSQDEANAINLDLTRGVVHPRVCTKCLGVAEGRALVAGVSVEHVTETEDRWMAEAAGRLFTDRLGHRRKPEDDPPEISTDDVLWAARRIEDQDPDTAAALRRAERIFRRSIESLYVSMTVEDVPDGPLA